MNCKFSHISLLYFLILLPSFVQAQHLPNQIFDALDFRNVGPTRGGRVTTVAGHADFPGTFYFGATGGGAWKSEDYGHSWQNVSDGFFQTGSIGAIAVAPSDANIVYIGTGSDGLRSNVIIGKGIYKSTDAGKTWSHQGLDLVGQIGSVIVHPGNADIAYLAAIGNPFIKNSERGIYKTVDGGQEWKPIYHHSDSVGVVDLEFAPNNPEVVYAALWRAERKPWTIISGAHQVGGILKSSDAGTSWSSLKTGLPGGLIGKTDLAVSPAAPDHLWALVEAPQGEGGVFVSKNQGDSFDLVSTKKELLDRPFYYCNIDVNPLNPNSIYINTTRFWHSPDGGKTWKSKSTPHGDNHDMWINPQDSHLFVQANDGGANVTRDGGETWSSILNQPTAELYQVAVDDQYPYWLYAGQQDNSTISVPSNVPHSAPGGTTSYWLSVGGCETGPAIPKPGAHHIVYANCKGRFGVYNKLTGQEKQYYVGATNIYGHNPSDLKFRFQRVSPIHISPHNADLVYHASQYLHKTLDDGQTWQIISPDLTAFTAETQVISGSPITRDITGEEYFSTIYAVQESPVQEGVIWVGSNDGLIHVTQDGGTNWTNVTPSGLLPYGRVQNIEASPHEAGRAYAAIYRYLMGDFRPYIYRTDDFGVSWTLLTDGKNGIPQDFPTRVVREDPEVPGILFAGTEFGLFTSLDDGDKWQAFQQNLPVTPITDLKLAHGDLILSTMGRSFWILDQVSTVRQAAETKLTGNIVFHPDDAIRSRHRSVEGPPSYPAAAAIIDYFIRDEPVEEVVLEILNDSDQVIRTFTSSKEEEKKEQEEEMSTGFGFSAPPVNISKSTGGHRIRWDLRHQGRTSDSGRKIPGPMVAPGQYRINFRVGSQVITTTFRVVPDPRLDATDAVFLAQEKLALDVMELQKNADMLNQKIGKKRKSFPDETGIPANIEAIHDALNTAEGRYQTPMLIDQLRYLFSMLNRADQTPGKDAFDRYAELKSTLERLQSDAKNAGLD